MHEPPSLLYDKNGEEHYNLISALHKSMRNSDPDAAGYWMYRMLDGGEDPLYMQGGWCVLPARMWGWRIQTPCKWQLRHIRRAIFWECRSVTYI